MSDGLLVASLLPSILNLFGIQDYKGLDTGLKNQLTQFAQSVIEEWQNKQQAAAYSGDYQSGNLPNKNQLQALMYQTFANETKQLAQAIQDAQDKDIKNWDKNRGWYMLQDGADALVDAVTKVPDALIGAGMNAMDKVSDNMFNYSGMYKDWKEKIRSSKKKYNSRNRHLLKAKENAAKVLKSQKETFNKFNNYVIQSRDRFGKETNSKSDNNLRNDKLTERTNRETKF